jgi:hypothetical protein
LWGFCGDYFPKWIQPPLASVHQWNEHNESWS